jgi:glycosyltransferase involved in cell wall biosynthesis
MSAGATVSPRPLRLTIVQGAFLPVPPRLGGAVEKAWYALGREFARRGHAVTHLGRRFDGLPDRETDGGVDYRRVRGHAAPAQLWRLKLLDLLYSLRVRRVLPPADILITNTFWLPLLARRPAAGRTYVHVARYPKGQLRHYPRTAVLQTVSSAIRDAILAEVPDAAARTCVVPYPVSPASFSTPDGERENTFLYVGRIHPEKGVHLLVDAYGRTAAARQGWKLRLVGPWAAAHGGGGESYREQLARRAAAAGGTVEFTGPVFAEPDLVAHYRRAAVFVYPSLAERGETFGLAVLEAMAAGCPPIVSDLACFRDFVRDGANGLAFDHRAADAADRLAARMTALAAAAPERLRLARAAAATARTYSLEAVADQFIASFHAFLPSVR